MLSLVCRSLLLILAQQVRIIFFHTNTTDRLGFLIIQRLKAPAIYGATGKDTTEVLGCQTGLIEKINSSCLVLDCFWRNWCMFFRICPSVEWFLVVLFLFYWAQGYSFFQEEKWAKGEQSRRYLYLKLPWTHFHTMKWAHSVNLAERLQIFGITLSDPWKRWAVRGIGAQVAPGIDCIIIKYQAKQSKNIRFNTRIFISLGCHHSELSAVFTSS